MAVKGGESGGVRRNMIIWDIVLIALSAQYLCECLHPAILRIVIKKKTASSPDGKLDAAFIYKVISLSVVDVDGRRPVEHLLPLVL